MQPSILLFCAAACQNAPGKGQHCLELPAEDGAVVARVGNVAITVHEIAERIREQGSVATRRYADRDKLREFVEDQVRFELLVRAGLERGLANDPAVVEAARKVMVRKLLQTDLGPVVFGNDEVAEAAIVAYYDKHQDQYRQPEKRRLAHIQLAPTPEGKAMADNLLAKLKARPDDRNLFRLLAAQHSLDAESKQQGGELAFRSNDEMTETYGPSFAARLFKMQTGTYADAPLQSTRGWHVVKLLADREALTRSIDEVRDDIRERLLKGQRAEYFEKYLAEIKERYPVAIYQDRLTEVPALLSTASEEAE